ncbi:fatty acid desaturase [Arundinibacter roseus]|uniref:Fatty acid desaturase n=1 Tax=Arundinibacter roseus TaxID=2070510 RepID=A0A4R4K3N5_9BACT|nr:fatty acid desaturase [Arundinibacter roseus]TDB61192.1 fatty acid desaturase [Arundinibacter roseus]
MHTLPRIAPAPIGNKGLWAAAAVLGLWAASLIYLLSYPFSLTDPLLYVFVLVQTHLYTGVFITAHDAIHGVVAPDRPRLNTAIGWVATALFAFNDYKVLSRKHHLHHQHSGTFDDPDYHEGNPAFLFWYYSFLKEYISVKQVLLMAVTYNLLKIVFPWENLVVFWMIPAILSTFQLFFFGTFLPHRGEHHNPPLNARSQTLNHIRAFFSCYFFGYHLEHHAYPYLPWWRLPRAREQTAKVVAD